MMTRRRPTFPTFVAAEVLPAALAVARPVGDGGAPLARGALGPRRVVPGDDLDPQDPVGEVDRVEGELVARAAARPREVRLHAGRTTAPSSPESNPNPNQRTRGRLTLAAPATAPRPPQRTSSPPAEPGP